MGRVVARRVSSMEEREEELELEEEEELELLWVEVRRVGKEKGIFVVFLVSLVFMEVVRGGGGRATGDVVGPA